MVLQPHPDIALIEEDDAHFHRPGMPTHWLDLDRVRAFEPAGVEAIGFKAPRDTHRIEAIFSALPGVRILWIEREVYPVVASMLSLRTTDGCSWAARYAPLEIEKAITDGSGGPALTVALRRAAGLADPRRRAVGLAALCWRVKQDCGRLAMCEQPRRVHRLSYERLVPTPRETLSAVLEFLGLGWDEAVLAHPDSLSGRRPGGSDPRRPIDPAGLSRWRSCLSAADRVLIDAVARDRRVPAA